MSVKIEIHQEREVVEGPLYRVKTSVVHATGIDRRIFVYKMTTAQFSHVATTWDMENFPGSLEEAQAGPIEFYRQDSCTKDYEDAEVAAQFATYTRSRIDWLARQYAIMQEDFVGSGDYEYTGG